MPLTAEERQLRRNDKQAHMIAVLDRYVHWLNLWGSDDPHATYSLDTFLVSDKKRELYGRSRQIARYTADMYDVRVYEFDDGEQGVQTVTGYFNVDILSNTRPPRERIAYITQLFDSYLTTIYDLDHFVNFNTPSDKKEA